MKLPLKTRILQYAIDLGKEKDFILDDIMKDLSSEYSDERIFTRKQVEEYMDSYLGVGFFNGDHMEFDPDGNLVIHCKVTDYGLSRKKYIKH